MLLLALVSCAFSGVDNPFPPPRPLGQHLGVREALASQVAGAEGQWPELAEPTGALDLRQALALALRKNPELAAFSWEVRAAEARELQARLLPNPEAAVEFENVGGNLRGFRESETTLSLAQSLLFGPKRARAIRLAAADRALAGWEYESKRLDVFSGVVQAFVGVLGAQERVKLAQETTRIAQEVLSAAAQRVEAGAAPSVERTRAEVVHARAATELDRARQELQAARVRLAALWASAEPRFSEARGTLEYDATLPALELLRKRLEQNPELTRAAAEVVKRQAALALERAKRIPDVSAGAGYRRLEGERVDTFVFGFSVPLPIFDRNQAAIREAKANLERAQWQKKDAEVRVLAALTDAYSELAATLKERQAFDTKILPGSTEAFRKTHEGYAQGRFDYLELLTAQETLGKTRADYVNVLVRLNQAIATVERLIGEPVVSPAPPAQERKEQK
jgi:cobalt-zinc-cadmium efflux system outer membrane protein